MIVVETLEHLNKYIHIVKDLPLVKAIVIWDQVDSIPEMAFGKNIYSFNQFLQIGKDVKNHVIEDIMEA